MKYLAKWLINSIVFITKEFIGQIIAAGILLASLVAWFYFSTIYAAFPVIIIGLLLWAFVGKVLPRLKKGCNNKPNNASQ